MSDDHDGLVRRILDQNDRYVPGHRPGVGPRPALRLAIVTCMDTRIDVLSALGLQPGDAHILRNAGGVVTDDVLRSLCLSRMVLGTRDVFVVQHTGCGLEGVSDSVLKDRLMDETGMQPSWVFRGFDDAATSVRESVEVLRTSPFVAERVSGFVLDVGTGRLEPVGVA